MQTLRLEMNRRHFFKFGATASAGVGAATMMSKLSWAAEAERPHYFLQVFIPQGVDASYLFDARPLSMTADKKIANYLGKDPNIWTGSNGFKTLATSVVKPMEPWKEHFSVINGVVMAAGFEGHDQSTNSLLTGNPFGGESYLPWLVNADTPMNYVQSEGFLLANLTNTAGSLKLSPTEIRELAKRASPFSAPQNPSLNFLKSRADVYGKGSGSFSASSRRLSQSLGQVPDLSRRIASIKLLEKMPNNNDDPITKQKMSTRAKLEMICGLMKAGVTRSGLLMIGSDGNGFLNIDSHDQKTAKELPQTLAAVIASVTEIFSMLSAMPSSNGRSMLDDTTVAIASEFSRTMRQEDVEFEATGTDHNSLTNTIILAGRGIKGGQVIGMSDYSSSNEDLSGAHLAFDPKKLKIMGCPFDHQNQISLPNLKPNAYDPSQYITASHVANTLQDILGLPASRRFLLGRNLPAAPSLSVLKGS